MKRLGPVLEVLAAIALSPLVIWGGERGALVYFAALCILAAAGVRREIAAPLERLSPKSDGEPR